MTRRKIIPVAIGALTLWLAATGSASAAPPNRTALTISCDRGTERATAVVYLKDTVDGVDLLDPPITLACGSDPDLSARNRQVVTTAVPAGYGLVEQFDITTVHEPPGTTRCGAEGTLALKLNCSDSWGVGATVTLR